MKQIEGRSTVFGFDGTMGIDTIVVLFLLALEYGRAVQALSIDGLLMGITMIMVLVLPYLLPSRFDKAAFGQWMLGRGTVAVFGIFTGLAFRRLTGTTLPDAASSLPLTLLIVASMVSCYVQFYGLMRLRLVK